MLNIVGTPIGNLGDLSFRQAEVLSMSDVILSEDTRTTQKILDQVTQVFTFSINPHQKIHSYYKEVEFEKLPFILDRLREEKNVSLISQAGMPVISDPGNLLVQRVIKEGIPFTVIPGPTAATTAVVYSGFAADKVLQLGFLPKKKGQLTKLLSQINESATTLGGLTVVCYDSPLRVTETLQVIAQIFPDREVCVCREMTKKFEEVIRGIPQELATRSYKGEITLVLSLS